MPKAKGKTIYAGEDTYLTVARRLKGDGFMQQDIAARLGVSESAISKWLAKCEPLSPYRNEHEPLCTDKISPAVGGWDLLDEAIRRESFDRQCEYTQDSATVEIKTDRPIVVVHSADWHLGSLATDHKHFKDWIHTIAETPDVYLVTAGVDLESRGHFKSIAATLRQVLTPEQQQDLFATVWQMLVDSNKIICGCWDNHLDLQYQSLIGFCPSAKLMARDRPYFRGIGLLKLVVGDVDYSYTITHKTRFNSSFNATHGAKRITQVNRAPTDVSVCGHYHSPAIEEGYDAGAMRPLGYDIGGHWIAIRTGTFKTNDAYSMLYWQQGIFAAPIIVFHPTHKQMIPFMRLDDALCYVEGYNQRLDISTQKA